ncbi:sulfite exporter TauE/SafE family protein [Actinomarinicola tropica]|uniref:Probable membrane transporter protein n=1 Tax=Actinomarinicola tropica TaxID=2789776 RepID=A0A5Q2RCJ4_9ACTN|nr:sulfite exporter TauE/SafE family protein [Actinomarinicola tropica]QGG94568.1 TSUP family transporter [Actinomarinicola tropica]
MTPLEAAAVVAAGFAAGGVNVLVGSGSLITFPTLLAVGFPAVEANVANNIGLVPGSASGVYGFRRELHGQGARARRLAAASAAGGLTGAILLLTLPSAVFDAVVPALILVAVALMAVQPKVALWLASRRRADAPDVTLAPLAIVFLGGIYGGYFGAAQGVILLAVLGAFIPDDLRRTNALKNVLAGTVNGVAAVLFVLVADVRWEAVGLVAVGALAGGVVGARIGRRIPAQVLRMLVVVLGTAVAISLIVS